MHLYKVVKSLITPEEARKLADIIKTEKVKKGDQQVPKSDAYYSLPSCSVLLGQLTDKISEISEIFQKLQKFLKFFQKFLNFFQKFQKFAN